MASMMLFLLIDVYSFSRSFSPVTAFVFFLRLLELVPKWSFLVAHYIVSRLQRACYIMYGDIACAVATGKVHSIWSVPLLGPVHRDLG